MNNELLLRLLTAVPLFQDFTADELGKFLSLCRQQHLPEQHVVIWQDREGSELYAVMSGSLRVSCRAATPKEKALELAILKPGDVFGELALVDHGPRSASVTTLEPTRIICFDRSQMASLPATQQVKLYHNVALLLSRRLRHNNDLLSVLLSHNKPAPEPQQRAATTGSGFPQAVNRPVIRRKS